MRIIIDGNDGVGKTTLAKRLMKDLDIKSYIHLSYNDPRDYEFYKSILKKENVIFDRSFMDEIIYSEVFSRDPQLTEYESQILHDFVKDQKVVVIICRRSSKLYDSNEEQSIIDNSEKIDEYFSHLAFKHGYILWSTDTMTERDYKLLVNHLKEEQL